MAGPFQTDGGRGHNGDRSGQQAVQLRIFHQPGMAIRIEAPGLVQHQRSEAGIAQSVVGEGNVRATVQTFDLDRADFKIGNTGILLEGFGVFPEFILVPIRDHGAGGSEITPSNRGIEGFHGGLEIFRIGLLTLQGRATDNLG